jgi:3-isopropylmalate/(R)-2-methylmalate dehydratase large subunit
MATLFEKIWRAHEVRDLGGGWSLLHIDRTLLHDLSVPQMEAVAARGLAFASPELLFATPDHTVSSAPGRTGETYPVGARFVNGLRQASALNGVRLFDLDGGGQGIVHVIGPELGLVLPGLTVICGDSHTCTNGALGALALGIGTSEGVHALATSTLRLRRLRQMRLVLNGALGQGVSAKDVILHIIGKLGVAAGVEHAVEFAGSAVRAMGVEARLTLCNLSVELGARSGIIAPDETVFDYLRGRRFAPAGKAFETALATWRKLHSDDGAVFDRDETFDVATIEPTITWGTSPEHAIAIGGAVPDPAREPHLGQRGALEAALAYMGLNPGQPIAGVKIDRVFIGSCANSRLSDLRTAAQLARGRRVASGVSAWVVPGSEAVKRAAEAEGLDRIFLDAGFAWREPGCSMCVAANGEQAPPGARVVSTSNRNFVGRQGPDARTHLASPAMAVAAAVTGELFDVRRL